MNRNNNLSKLLSKQDVATPQDVPATTTPLVKKFDLAALSIRPRNIDPFNVPFPIRLPDSREFFRVNPDPSCTASLNLFEDKKTKKIYIVDPDLEDEFAGDDFPADLFLAVNRECQYFIIYCKRPSRPDEPYATTRFNIVEDARKTWLRMRRMENTDGYESVKATGSLPEPIWPVKSFADIMETSAADVVINDVNHPIVKWLHGEV